MLLQLLVPGCCRKEICSVLTTLRTLISDNLYRSITLLYHIPIEFPNRKRIAAKAAAKAPHNTTPSAKARMQAAKAPRKLCESKPGLYKKVIGVFEAAQLQHMNAKVNMHSCWGAQVIKCHLVPLWMRVALFGTSVRCQGVFKVLIQTPLEK